MQEKFKLNYDFDEDLLYMYSDSKKSSGSIEFGDLVIDLQKNGSVAGLEVFGASKYFSELTNKKITKNDLSKIEKAELSMSTKNGTVIIKVLLPLDGENVPATIAIQDMNYKSPVLACLH